MCCGDQLNPPVNCVVLAMSGPSSASRDTGHWRERLPVAPRVAASAFNLQPARKRRRRDTCSLKSSSSLIGSVEIDGLSHREKAQPQ